VGFGEINGTCKRSYRNIGARDVVTLSFDFGSTAIRLIAKEMYPSKLKRIFLSNWKGYELKPLLETPSGRIKKGR
jgi:hypothetical protein